MRIVTMLVALAAGAGMLPVHAQETPAPAAASAAPATAVAVPVTAAPVAAPARAEVAKPRPTPPAVVARINLSAQRLDVTVGGELRHSWAISSGRAGYPTPRGTYRPQWTARMWYSRKYDNAPMPHAVFFTGGVAIHATSATGLLGRPASHGCVRLAPANAAQFYGLVQKHGLRNVRIEVFGTPPSSAVASRRERPETARRGLERGISVGTPVAGAWGYASPAGHASRGGRGGIERTAAARHPGMVHLPSGHPYKGRDSFEMNGVRYVRVR